MIGRLRGVLIESDDETLLIEVSGVGYVVRCGVRTLSGLPEAGSELILMIESQTREDGTKLYGFLNKDERKAFVALLGVQGVGPKAALSVLDVLSPPELASAITRDDRAIVGKAQGVGPKLAQRIVLELKGKPIGVDGDFVVTKSASPYVVKPSLTGDCVTALMGLGITETLARQASEKAVREIGEEAGLSALIKLSLKLVGA